MNKHKSYNENRLAALPASLRFYGASDYARLRCFFGRHQWKVHQHNVHADEGNFIFVIAFKVCKGCAKSKLIHLLE